MTQLALVDRVPVLPGILTRRFHRLELKYLVRGFSRRRLLRAIAQRLRPDPLADERGAYRVSSLYYDTPSLAIYTARRTRPDVDHGVKLRVRVYGTEIDASTPAMVELKGKQDGATIKERVSLPLADAYRLVSGADDDRFEDANDAALAREIAYFARRLQLRPAIAVTYDRFAFVGEGRDQGLRITLDQRLECRLPRFRLERRGPFRRFMPADAAVLELKASGSLPTWIDDLLRGHAEPRRLSKYVAAMSWLRQEA